MDESYTHPGNNSSGASSDFFSPISLGFFGKDVLPRTHDTSWIGARQSPIPSFDKEEDEEEEDEEENRATEVYHRALHESLQAAPFVNERTSLLHHRRTAAVQARQAPIHPLWDGATPEERLLRDQKTSCLILWGDFLVLISGIHLVATSVYEVYQWRTEPDSGLELTWMSIIEPRTSQTLLFFGGLDAEKVILNSEYWRLLSSLLICPSLLNWLLVFVGWMLVYHARRHHTLLSRLSWFGTWFGSAFVGLLWMMAWDLRIRPVVGCCLWGTGGVLTSIGIHRPEERWRYFALCILAVVLTWWEQPCNSVYGVLGATFWGWSLGVMTRSTQSLAEKGHGPSGLSFVGIGAVISIMLAPVLSIAFLGTNIAFLS